MPSSLSKKTLFAVWKIRQFFSQSKRTDRHDPPPLVHFRSLFKDPLLRPRRKYFLNAADLETVEPHTQKGAIRFIFKLSFIESFGKSANRAFAGSNWNFRTLPFTCMLLKEVHFKPQYAYTWIWMERESNFQAASPLKFF